MSNISPNNFPNENTDFAQLYNVQKPRFPNSLVSLSESLIETKQDKISVLAEEQFVGTNDFEGFDFPRESTVMKGDLLLAFSLSHCDAWNTECKDVIELKAVLDVPLTAPITKESVVRFFLAPKDNLVNESYYEKGYLVLLCYVLIKMINDGSNDKLKLVFQSVLHSYF